MLKTAHLFTLIKANKAEPILHRKFGIKFIPINLLFNLQVLNNTLHIVCVRMDGGLGSDTSKQASHVWAMLDEMASSDPAAYQRFIKNDGGRQAKHGSTQALRLHQDIIIVCIHPYL